MSQNAQPAAPAPSSPETDALIEKHLQSFEKIATFSKDTVPDLKKIILAWVDVKVLNDYLKASPLVVVPALFKNVRRAFVAMCQRTRSVNPGHVLTPDVRELLSFVLWCSKMGVIDANRSIKFVEEIFECLQLKEIRELFDLVEREIIEISETVQNDAISNPVLRLCNSIFRKLSRTQDVELRGRLHIFLTKLLQLCHASGQNRKGQYNENNETIIEGEDARSGEAPASQRYSFAFFRQFWALQKYFIKPQTIVGVKEDNDLLQAPGTPGAVFAAQSTTGSSATAAPAAPEDDDKQRKKPESKSLEKRKLDAICAVISHVMDIFRTTPVEDSGNTAIKRYPKFLSTHQLLEIQLQDAVFRKVFCVQCVLFFFNLTTSDKSQLALSEQMVTEIKTAEQNVKKTLRAISEALREAPLDDQLNVFLDQERQWQKMKTEEWRNNRDTFVALKADQQVVDTIRQAAQIALAPQSATNGSGLFAQRLSVGGRASDAALRKHVKSMQALDSYVCKPTSAIRSLIDIDPACKFAVDSDPILQSVGYYYDQVLDEMREARTEERLKDSEINTWKALRVLGHFDLQRLRDAADKPETRDLDKIAVNLLEVHAVKSVPLVAAVQNQQSPNGAAKRSPPSTNKYETIAKHVKKD